MAVLQIGAIIRRRREEMGLTQNELAAGICSVPTLSRIERGDRMPGKDNLEQLLQKIGYSDLMMDVWADEKEFQRHKLKFQIRQAVIVEETEKAKALLEEFGRVYDEESALDKQFYLLQSTILNNETLPLEVQKAQLEEALRLTCPQYDEKSFPAVLTYEEILLINNLALCYGGLDERRKAIELLYKVKNFYDNCAVSIEETLRTEPMILYNLSKYLGLERRYEECMEICDLGIRLAQRTGRCLQLAKTLYNRAWAMVKKGLPQDRAEAKRYAEQALHVAEAMGQKECVRYCKEFLAESFPEGGLL